MSEIILPGGASSRTKGYVVRFENGASMVVQASSIGAAPGDAFVALLGCLPKDSDPTKVVQPVAVQLMENVCSVCGTRFTKKGEFVEFQPNTGNPSVICIGCAGAVCEATAALAAEAQEQKQKEVPN